MTQQFNNLPEINFGKRKAKKVTRSYINSFEIGANFPLTEENFPTDKTEMEMWGKPSGYLGDLLSLNCNIIHALAEAKALAIKIKNKHTLYKFKEI